MRVRRGSSGVAVWSALLLILATGCAPGGLVPTPPSTPSVPPSSSGTSSSSTTGSPAPVLISIDRPAAGAVVTVPLTVNGTANTFEAALIVDALDEAGDPVCVRQTMADSGTGTPGSWEATLAFAPTGPGAGQPLTVRAYELSARDGSVVNLVERHVTLSTAHPDVLLTSPQCGDTVPPGGSIAVTGLATVFEAALTVEVRDASGAVVLSRDLLAELGGVESAFSTIFVLPAGLPGGFYDVVAFNRSPKDGSIVNAFPVQVLVQS